MNTPSPKIAVTSASFSSNQALVSKLLSLFPETSFNSSEEWLSAQALQHALQGAKGAIVGKEKVDGSLLEKCPDLEIISKYGVGLDNIDLKACKEKNVQVSWTEGTNKHSVAELTLGFMLTLTHNTFVASQQLKAGQWKKPGSRQLSGSVVGIIGLGNVGKEVAKRLKPFGCRVLANDLVDISSTCNELGLEVASKDEIYRQCDIISLHVPLTPETHHLMEDETFTRLKSNALLINTARGSVVKQSSLMKALENGNIAGAALDVFEKEPCCDPKLLNLPNLVATPHMGANTSEAAQAMGSSAIQHLQNHFSQPNT